MVLGTIDSAVNVSYDCRLIKSCKDGQLFRALEESGFLYNVGTPVKKNRGETKKMTCWK